MSTRSKTSTCARCCPSRSPTGACILGTVAVGLILPWAAIALGVPLAVALVVPALLTWRRGGDDEMADLAGHLSARIVDALAGAPELLAFGAADAVRRDIEASAARVGRAGAPPRPPGRRVRTRSSRSASPWRSPRCSALGVAAVHAHHLGQVMVAVLPLAALATFETVPGVPLGVARSLSVRASADRLFALDDVAGAGPRPGRILGAGAGARRARCANPRRVIALRPRSAPRTRRRHPRPSPGRAARDHRIERRRQVEPRQRAVALLATRGRHARPRRHRRRAPRHERTTRSVFALADQRAQMFAGTIRSNLTLARPDATDDELADALRTARLDAWVAALPDGLDTPVGEGRRRPLGRRAPAPGRCARAAWRPGRSSSSTSPPAGWTHRSPARSLDGVLAAAAGAGRASLVITHRPAEAARCDASSPSRRAGSCRPPPNVRGRARPRTHPGHSQRGGSHPSGPRPDRESPRDLGR